MQQDYVTTQPFHTTNALLAYCLHLAGVPWENDNTPVHVFYSESILLKWKNGAGEPIYKGVELRKAVEDAHKAGRRGHVEYVFKRTSRLPFLLVAFQEQSDEIEKEGNDTTLDKVVPAIFAACPERDIALMRLACLFLKLRVPFMELWQNQVPLIMIPNPGRTVRTRETFETRYGMREGEVVTTAGHKIVSLNASDETLKQLGLLK